MDKEMLKRMIQEILAEGADEGPVLLRHPAQVHRTEADRLDTGNPSDRVWTHDLFSLAESPRLGCGIMEMERTTFPWTLQYDEIDYVISGQLTVEFDGHCVTAAPGELILIPSGSSIRFSAPDRARFLYVTDPADWQNGLNR